MGIRHRIDGHGADEGRFRSIPSCDAISQTRSLGRTAASLTTHFAQNDVTDITTSCCCCDCGCLNISWTHTEFVIYSTVARKTPNQTAATFIWSFALSLVVQIDIDAMQHRQSNNTNSIISFNFNLIDPRCFSSLSYARNTIVSVISTHWICRTSPPNNKRNERLIVSETHSNQ